MPNRIPKVIGTTVLNEKSLTKSQRIIEIKPNAGQYFLNDDFTSLDFSDSVFTRPETKEWDKFREKIKTDNKAIFLNVSKLATSPWAKLRVGLR